MQQGNAGSVEIMATSLIEKTQKRSEDFLSATVFCALQNFRSMFLCLMWRFDISRNPKLFLILITLELLNETRKSAINFYLRKYHGGCVNMQAEPIVLMDCENLQPTTIIIKLSRSLLKID